MIADDVGYFIYESDHVLLDQSQSEYLWWHKQGLAGCILRPHLRQRLGVSKANAQVHTSLFDSHNEETYSV